jgi:hypothetical protein
MVLVSCYYVVLYRCLIVVLFSRVLLEVARLRFVANRRSLLRMACSFCGAVSSLCSFMFSSRACDIVYLRMDRLITLLFNSRAYGEMYWLVNKFIVYVIINRNNKIEFVYIPKRCESLKIGC